MNVFKRFILRLIGESPVNYSKLAVLNPEAGSLNGAFGISNERSKEFGKQMDRLMRKLIADGEAFSKTNWMPQLYMDLLKDCRNLAEFCVFSAVLATNLDTLKYAYSQKEFEKFEENVKSLRGTIKMQGNRIQPSEEETLKKLDQLLSKLSDPNNENK